MKLRFLTDSFELEKWENVTGRQVTLFNKFDSILSRLMMPWPTSICCSFFPSSNNLGTIFTQTFRMPNYFRMIIHTFKLFISNSFAIILLVRWRSQHAFCCTRSIFSSIYLVEGLPVVGSSSMFSLLSLSFLCLSKLDNRHSTLGNPSFPKTYWSNSSDSVKVFSSQTRNLKLNRYSVLIIASKELP